MYQAKTVKTHSNNLVVLAHVQLKPFYRLSTRDVTHVRKCTRPSPALPYCKRREAGRGPGNEATHTYISLFGKTGKVRNKFVDDCEFCKAPKYEAFSQIQWHYPGLATLLNCEVQNYLHVQSYLPLLSH